MRTLICAAIGLTAAASLSPASAECVRGEVEAGAVVLPWGGHQCPGDDPWSRPTKEQRLAAERQAAAVSVQERQARQGRGVRRMSDDQCYALLRGVPNDVAVMGSPWHPGEPSPDNPYMTAQENWCMALGRGQTSVADHPFPGFLPDGYHATYLGNGHWRISR
jgi:hypothetical protein